MEKIRGPLQQSLQEAGFEDFVSKLKEKDAQIIVNPYVNVHEMAEVFFKNPEETLENWLALLRTHEEEMKAELDNPPENKKTVGYYLIEEVLEAIETVGKYGFAGIPKCLGENEEWCQFLIYSGCLSP